MKTKITLSITSFSIAFAIGLMIFALSTFGFQKNIDPITKAKIYSVFQQDAQNRKVKIEKITNRKEGDHIAFFNAINDFGEASEKIDVSDTPEDFQIAWKEYVTTQTEWSNLLNHLDNMPYQSSLTKAEAKIADRKISEEKSAWNNLVSIAKTYGFKFDDKENLINELQDN